MAKVVYFEKLTSVVTLREMGDIMLHTSFYLYRDPLALLLAHAESNVRPLCSVMARLAAIAFRLPYTYLLHVGILAQAVRTRVVERNDG